MNPYIENIYRHSPILIQNMFCSIYGFKLYRERYGSPWREYYKHLKNSQYATKEEIKKIQLNALKIILLHAIEYVPHYQNVLKNMKSDIESLNSLAVIKDLPILEKSLLREMPQLFISKYYNKHKLLQINTSGTTGSPLTIYITPKARKMNYAFFARSKSWAGIMDFEKSITFAGRTIVPIEQSKPPYWRHNYYLNNLLMSSYHLSGRTIEDYVQKIRKFKPLFIDSYPSSLSTVADYIIMKNISDIHVQSIITSAETLLDYQRNKIEKAFNCRVYDQYGSAEQVVFACQCEEGIYHINSEYGYVEVLNGKNEPASNGELGEIVCTGFTNDAMPLIRYRIGDMGILRKEQCKCGRNFPIIREISGRKDDILLTPDGRYIGRLDPIFKGMESSIIEAQIVQEKLDLIKVLIVKAANYRESHGAIIVKELKKRMGEAIVFKILYVESIPRTQNGKFRAVVSNIKRS
jgi:phenylacetate-CoA ligase